MLTLGILGFVCPSAPSGSYAPGPIVSIILGSRFSAILKPLTPVLNLTPSSYWPGATLISPPLAKDLGRLGELPILILGIFAFVIASALSGEYSPGPALFLTFSARFSPKRNDFTSELNRFPSSYWPGPALSICSVLAKVPGLAFVFEKVTAETLHFVAEDALSTSYYPGPAEVSSLLGFV